VRDLSTPLSTALVRALFKALFTELHALPSENDNKSYFEIAEQLPAKAK
jgi:hypothetical protein